MKRSLCDIMPLFNQILSEQSDLEVCLYFNKETLKSYGLELWIIQFTLWDYLPKELIIILEKYGFDRAEQEEPYR